MADDRSDEPAILICTRKDDRPTWVPGSVEADCIDCGAIVMVSPQSMKVHELHKQVAYFCLECASQRYADKKAEMLPGQEGELDGWLPGAGAMARRLVEDSTIGEIGGLHGRPR